MEIRKVPAAAGAQWLLDAARLLARSPAGYGLLAAIYAGLTLTLLLATNAAPALVPALEVILLVIGPLLMAGMIFAAQEVDRGHGATPSHLLAALRTGRAGRVLSTLIPQIAVLLIAVALFVAVVGVDGVEKFSDFMLKAQAEAQRGGKIDPALIAALPLDRLGLWLLMLLGIGLVMLFLTFTVLPDIMFGDVGLVAAMKRSLAACLRNIPAMIVFMVMAAVMLFVIGIAVGILMAGLQLVLGPSAGLIVNALFNGVMVCFITGAMYFGWKDMLGSAAGDAAAAPPSPSGVAM